MPSIPQSLLWISLVVLWLFVLVPMLISKRDNVRRTSDVALATRVLNTGGRGARLLRKRGPAAGHHSDPNWRPTDDYADDDDFEGDDAHTAPRKSIVLAANEADTDSLYLDVDVVEEDSGALPVGASATQNHELMLDLELDETDEPEPEAVEEPSLDATAAIRTVTDADFASHAIDSLDDVEELEDEAESDDAAAMEEDDEPDGTEHDYEYVDDSSGLEAPESEPVPSLSKVRSQRFETATAAKVSARKFQFRKRMLLGMGTALLASAVVAYFVTPSMWWVSGTIGAITLLYLAYLRRQTRIEEQLRRRRAQRMARSRLGVENTEDQEFDVVPSRLRRPGSMVLEIDDEDPVFEHLEYVTYAREYDLPRAAGQ